jgi:hypothetical protein
LQRLFGGRRAALRAISADFQTTDHNVEQAIALDLAFEAVEEIALEFHDLSAAQTGHMDVIALGTAFVKMLFPLHVHEIEFINQSMAFEKPESAIDGDTVNARIEFARVAKNLCSIEVLLSSFHDAQYGPSLVRQSNAA